MGRVGGEGILKDCGEIVDELFDSGKGYQTKTTYRCPNLEGRTGNVAECLKALYGQIKRNWSRQGRPEPRSCENWRWKAHLDSDASRGPGDEVRLERNIVQAMGSANAGWVNAVPTSSGLIGAHDKARNIDLVHWCGDSEYTFFELKVDQGAGTPIAAAIQITCYGALNVFTRLHIQDMTPKVRQSPMLSAGTVHLRVLAPRCYYHADHIDLSWFEDRLDRGIQDWLGTLRTPGQPALEPCLPKMDFSFLMFPDTFDVNMADPKDIKWAMENRRSVYQSARSH